MDRNEAIKVVKSHYPANKQMLNEALEFLIPELKESEDERIRKELIKFLQECHNIDSGFFSRYCEIPFAQTLAWLENQGESSDKIHYWTEEEIEPIISDYLRGAEHYGGMIGRLRCLKPKSLEKQGDSPIKWNKNTEGNKPQVNHSVLMKTTHGIAEGEWQGEYWHQYRWAGIVRDSDVLSWIEFSDLDKQVEQKPAWSEEDERMFDYALDMIEWYGGKNEKRVRLVSDWLKSLKQRIGG